MNKRMHRVLAALGVVLVLALPTGAQVWPSPSQLDTHVPSSADPVLLMWVMQYETEALTHDPARVMEGNIFWPRRDAIAWSENVLAYVPVFGAVWYLAGRNPVLAFNVVLFTSYLAGAIAVLLLAHHLLRDLLASLVAAAAFSFTTFRSVGVVHMQLAGFLFVPLALLFLMRFLERRRWRDAIALGVTAAGTWLTTAYFAVLLALVLAAFLGVWLIQRRLHPGARFLRGMLLAAGVAALIAGPFVVPYARLQGSGRFASSEVAHADARDLVRLPPSRVYRDLSATWLVQGDENALFPGLVLTGLAVVAVARGGWRQLGRSPYALPLVASAGACCLLVLGPDRWGPLDWPYRAAREVVPGVASLRAITRLWVFPLFCIALVAGAGMKRLLARWTGRKAGGIRFVIAGIAFSLICAEMLYRPAVTSFDLSPRRLAVYETLDRLPAGAVTEVPVAFGWLSPYVLASRQLRSLTDGKPRVEGYSGSFPQEFYTMQAIASAFPEPVSIEGLRRFGVRYVVVHTNTFPCLGAYGPKEIPGLRARLRAAPGVARVIDAHPDFIVELEPDQVDRDRLPTVPQVVRPVYPCPSN